MEKGKNKRGYISLHRKIDEGGLWLSEPFTRGQAWVDLLLLANHKEESKPLFIRGNKIDVKRGQVSWSKENLASRWRWSRGKVLRFLKLLETEQQIVQQKSPVLSVITIVNYKDYQKKETTDGTTDGQQTVQQTDNRRYTFNNGNNENNGNKESITLEKNQFSLESSFEDFWKSYIPVKTEDGKFVPKGDKQPAKVKYVSFLKASKDPESLAEEIKNGLQNYLKTCSRTNCLTKHAVRFLRNETWKEYQEINETFILSEVTNDTKHKSTDPIIEKHNVIAAEIDRASEEGRRPNIF